MPLCLPESACFKRIELWWTYKFCFGRHVRQYHDDKEESMKADYALGFFDPTQEPDNEIRVRSTNLSNRT